MGIVSESLISEKLSNKYTLLKQVENLGEKYKFYVKNEEKGRAL